ncbi:flagellar filament capping protein FliD [Luteimonas sp. 100069]|uniref:flagellar filament capping protein FliD n=1 Tax=Luteimonas sp. 100069 TaxID=2006109 RepID=UPI000FAFBDB0|nr:flagellar filament capping protein FliD [Luteimonas sp. 100069]RPD88656.1 flagellar hook protein FliD [Luteimonas sp. 100069]
MSASANRPDVPSRALPPGPWSIARQQGEDTAPAYILQPSRSAACGRYSIRSPCAAHPGQFPTRRSDMADYSFGYGGIGSGLDISAIVNQLVAADRAPQNARLNTLESNTKFKLSGLGSVTSAFSSLTTALDSLQKVDALGARTVSSTMLSVAAGNPGNANATTDPVLTPTAGRNTPVGSYQVEVHTLASAHKLLGSGTETGMKFSAGTLRVQIGEASVEVAVQADATLADIRSAINDAAGKHGVQAALLTSDNGHHLSIGSAKTGAENAISIQVVEGGSNLHSLIDGLEEQSPATDARVSIDGLVTTSASNTISDAVPGMTLALKQAGTSRVDVKADPAGSRAAVDGFVKAYNAALKAIGAATTYNAETKTPSSLTGDAQMRGAAAQLRGVMGELLAGLAEQGLDAKTLGLQTQGHPNPDGTLILDATKFNEAMTANSAQVIAAFTGENGLAAKVNDVVKSYVGTDGALTLRTKGLNDQLKDVARQREALDVRMDAAAKRYRTQFVALDSLMAQMTTTSSALAQQLTNLSAQTQR